MKKLMIASLASLAGVAAFGGLCDPEAAGPDSCSVYNIKFTFKTLAARRACAQGARWLVTDVPAGFEGIWGAAWYRNAAADSVAASIAATAGHAVSTADYVAAGDIGVTVCDNGFGGRIFNAARREVFWMDNATRKFEGIAWQCRSACFEGLFADCDFTNNGRLNYVLWEKRNSLAISYPVFQVKYGPTIGGVFDGTPQQEYFSLDAQREMLIGRYGQKAQKVTAYWELDNLLHGQSIDAAGFGTYDVKNLRTKSISGNAVGMIMPIQDGATDACGNTSRIFCALGFMCVEWIDWCCDGCYAGVDLVPASGTWSLKYNASATNRANADRARLTAFVPAYMFYSNDAWKAARAADPFLHTDGYYWWDDTNGTLFYKEYSEIEDGDAVYVTRDDILSFIAEGASNVIDIAFDGVYYSDEDGVGYIYGFDYEEGAPKKYELTGAGVLPESAFLGYED